jgi:4-hydroxybenzoate polyprenyltransferase
MHRQDFVHEEPSAKRTGQLRDYLKIARFDHSTKHIFIVPGVALAYLLRGFHNHQIVTHVLLGVLAAICVASANYVINEWLDRDFDRFHPTKFERAAVQRELTGKWVGVEWLCFLALGLTCAYLSSRTMFLVAIMFALQGLVYNVSPLRSKDKAYLDVISESVNNPLRLIIGWLIVDSSTLPPVSVILSYWLGGAFLMAAKRLSEYREIVASHGREQLVRYRPSFDGYTDTSLTVSCFVYAMLSVFFLAVFLMKYRIEYITVMPVVVALFGQYLALSSLPGSSAQRPEKLFRERRLMALVLTLTIGFIVATFVDMPLLEPLTAQRFIGLE